jgi:hypothetical protein
MAMPRPLPSEWLPDVRGCCDTVVAALSAVVDAPQVAAVQSLVEAAMTGFTERHETLTIASPSLMIVESVIKMWMENHEIAACEPTR